MIVAVALCPEPPSIVTATILAQYGELRIGPGRTERKAEDILPCPSSHYPIYPRMLFEYQSKPRIGTERYRPPQTCLHSLGPAPLSSLRNQAGRQDP